MSHLRLIPRSLRARIAIGVQSPEEARALVTRAPARS